jgi:hypothetical protein
MYIMHVVFGMQFKLIANSHAIVYIYIIYISIVRLIKQTAKSKQK